MDGSPIGGVLSDERHGVESQVIEMIEKRILELISAKPAMSLSDGTLEELFWQMHPRFRYFKSVPYNCKLLDIGAGDGGLSRWKSWQRPDREDIQMYGVEASRGELADEYADWQACNFDEATPDFGDVKFDAFMATQVIQHLKSLANLLAYLQSTARYGAVLYLEWPSPNATQLPRAAHLAETGFSIGVANFFDDPTHRRAFPIDEVVAMVWEAGFRPFESGVIALGDTAAEMLARGVEQDRPSWRQMGFWAATGWSAYLIALFTGS